MRFEFNVDSTQAQHKTRALKMLDRASQRCVQRWASLTLKAIKRGLTGRFLNTRSGKLKRVTAMKVETLLGSSRVILGTNVGKTKEEDVVKYASIHEYGGWIFPRNAKALTIPLAGTKGRAANFPGLFVIKTVTGGLLAQRTGKTGRSWRARFLLVKSVKMPARHWFTIPIAEMQPELKMMTSKEYILAEAAALAAKGRPTDVSTE